MGDQHSKVRELPKNTSALIVKPAGGWKQHTLYLVHVSWSRGNPIHQAYMEVGFLNDDGEFGSYCEVWQNSYDNAVEARKAFYLEPVKLLHTMEGYL